MSSSNSGFKAATILVIAFVGASAVAGCSSGTRKQAAAHASHVGATASHSRPAHTSSETSSGATSQTAASGTAPCYLSTTQAAAVTGVTMHSGQADGGVCTYFNADQSSSLQTVQLQTTSDQSICDENPNNLGVTFTTVPGGCISSSDDGQVDLYRNGQKIDIAWNGNGDRPQGLNDRLTTAAEAIAAG